MSAVDAVSDADIAGTVVEAIDSFDAMGLTEPLLRGIYAYGFEKPSAIQQRAIKPLMSGQDTIAQAQSGTGKTAAFGIGVLQTVDIEDRRTQALILAPTRELALQIQKVIIALGDYLKCQYVPQPSSSLASVTSQTHQRLGVGPGR
jgi:superfamily II DNA/RNA helicase